MAEWLACATRYYWIQRFPSRNITLRIAYGSPILAEMAASYAAGMILNNPFLDGNKRSGFMVAATFLELKGLEIIAAEESVVEMTLALERRTQTGCLCKMVERKL
jgi:prophage maintenance system killer protein